MYSTKEIIIIYQNCSSMMQLVDIGVAFAFLIKRGEQDQVAAIRRMSAITNARLLEQIKKNL